MIGDRDQVCVLMFCCRNRVDIGFLGRLFVSVPILMHRLVYLPSFSVGSRVFTWKFDPGEGSFPYGRLRIKIERKSRESHLTFF